jgi:hypothetical protein
VYGSAPLSGSITARDPSGCCCVSAPDSVMGSSTSSSVSAGGESSLLEDITPDSDHFDSTSSTELVVLARPETRLQHGI